MRVWLLWTGEYSAASVVAVYSSRELAEKAMALAPGGWIDQDDGYEIDADVQMIHAGVQQWRVDIMLESGDVRNAAPEWIGTGAPPRVTHYKATKYHGELLSIWMDARDKDHAVKIAGDERAKYLASQPIAQE